MAQRLKDLIKRCIKRERRAQYEFYKEHFELLFAVCYRYTQSREKSLDLMNLGFAKIMLSLEKYDYRQPLDKWMKTIVINVVIDEFRRTKTYERNIKIYDTKALENQAQKWEYDKNNGEIMQAIKIKLKDLNPVTRNIFNLYAVDGYKHKEIAKMLSIPEGTCHWHYSLAKKELKEFLTKEFGLNRQES